MRTIKPKNLTHKEFQKRLKRAWKDTKAFIKKNSGDTAKAHTKLVLPAFEGLAKHLKKK